MNVLRWLVDQLHVKRNAPRWAGLAVTAVTGWLATADIALSGEEKAALAVVIATVITTAIQKLATWPREDLLDGGTH